MVVIIVSGKIFSTICSSIQANFTALVEIEVSWQYHEEKSADGSDLAKPSGHKTQSFDVPPTHVSHVSKQSLHSPFSVMN